MEILFMIARRVSFKREVIQMYEDTKVIEERYL